MSLLDYLLVDIIRRNTAMDINNIVNMCDNLKIPNNKPAIAKFVTQLIDLVPYANDKN